MKPIPLGAAGEFSLKVERQHLANQFKDALLPPVLATPILILILENASLNAIRPYLDPGESAVGTSVDIKHISPTPLGHIVTGRAKVTGVDGRHIHLEVSAHDERDEIGHGHHSRAVINLANFTARLKLKH